MTRKPVLRDLPAGPEPVVPEMLGAPLPVARAQAERPEQRLNYDHPAAARRRLRHR